MRPAVPGTIPADGELPLDDHRDRGMIGGKPAATFAMTVSLAMAQRGQQRFGIYCAPCHGLAGGGDGMVSQRAIERFDPNWVKPRNLREPAVVQQPVGQLFQTITQGLITTIKSPDGTVGKISTMPSYAVQLSVEDRWAVVLYVKALERAHTATPDDLPAEVRSHVDR